MTGRTVPTLAAAVLLTIVLPMLAAWLPFAATIVACWVLAAVALVVAWCGACELVHRHRARRFNRHTHQALRVVE